MEFTIVYLAGERAPVQAEDHRVVLDAKEHLSLKRHLEEKGLIEAYDQTVKDFFEPIVEAAEKVNKLQAKEADFDPDFHVVFTEAVEGVEPVQREAYKLTKDTVILRLIEDGRTDRLIWVGDDLEILAATAV